MTLGVITNYDSRVIELVGYLDVDQHFDFIVHSEGAGCSKPDREIFNQAIKKSGLTKLTKTQKVHIGDDVDKDYLGALAAGWRAILLDRKGEIRAENTDPLTNIIPDSDLCKDFDEVALKWNLDRQ